MRDQKFNKYDHVKIAKDLGSSMSHFKNDAEAIVIGSYADQYGGSNTDSYTLRIKDHGQVSWYHEHQLTLIESNRPDILEKWESARKEEVEKKSDLDWIFSNPDEVLKNTDGATIEALSGCLGLTSNDLWGSQGEGIVYYQNSRKVLSMAYVWLIAKDKDGWLGVCDKFKESRAAQPAR